MNTVALDTADNITARTIKVAVIGGGITGLGAAHRLLSQSSEQYKFQVSLFEAQSHVGGIISTRHEDGCTFEEGPDSFVTMKPAAIDLCQELGIKDQVVTTNSQFRRAFIAWKDQLEPIPDGFNMIVPTRFDKLYESNLFSRVGKLRIAIEQFLPPAPQRDDESVASFIRRRFGSEALKRLGQPMIGGIYTADPEKLSLRASVPRYLDYEQKFGSVTKGLLAEQAASKQSRKPSHAGARYSAFVSFNKGLGILIDSLVASIGQSNIFTNSKVETLHYSKETQRWSLCLESNEWLEFDHIILTTPSFVTANLLKATDPKLANDLSKIEYASSAVLNLLFDRKQIAHALDGFGFVVPEAENRQIIAGSFNSVKFPGRCPENQAIIRVFMGGAMQEKVLAHDDETLTKIALLELDRYIRITGAPISSFVKRYPRSMPQYELNHHLLCQSLLAAAEKHPGLHLAGAYLTGVGIPDCIASANNACLALLESINLPNSG